MTYDENHIVTKIAKACSMHVGKLAEDKRDEYAILFWAGAAVALYESGHPDANAVGGVGCYDIGVHGYAGNTQIASGHF